MRRRIRLILTAYTSISSNMVKLLSILSAVAVMIVILAPCRLSICEEDPVWERRISLGYNSSSGNSETAKITARLNVLRKSEAGEFTLKADYYYSSSDNTMDSEKWYGMGRYDLIFGGGKWHNFYKIEADHDRFANVDYRIVPAVGIGYRFADEPDWKARIEGGFGWERTSYRDSSPNDEEVVFVPGALLERKFFENLTISEDLTLYPSLENSGEFRMHSDTSLTNPISDGISLSISVVNDYDSDPAGGKEKNDMRIISTLNVSF